MKCAKPYWLEASGDRRFFIACGKCLYCRIQRRKAWTMRMLHEITGWENSCFTTLTYAPENLPARGLRKKDLQKFFKRLRKKVRSLKYFACGEYGEDPRYTRRPHYHAIIFGISKAEADAVIPSVWGLGQVENGYAEEDSIRYVAGYIDKKWMSGDQKSVEFGGMVPPFQTCSQGIGKKWLFENWRQVAEDGLVFRGKNQAIPRYYIEKLKVWHPGVVDSVMMRREEEKNAREADETLEVLPETGGKNFLELTEQERDIIAGVRKEKGHIMQANLKAKARMYSLKKLEKGKSL